MASNREVALKSVSAVILLPGMDSISGRSRTPAVLLSSAFLLLIAGLEAYAQTRALAWDEGFHILTAQLIMRGKRPYIDFVFSQTPLNAYWNAGWMAVFGETWRVPHAIAALCSAGAVLLTAGYIFSRFPVSGWRAPGAVLVGLLMGLNVLVVRYGGIAQAYGLCLFSIVAAYRLAVRSVERSSVVSAGLAGLACGIAAGSSLLTAPVSAVLLIWILVYSPARFRWRKLAAFVLGEAAAFIPVLWLFAQGPRQVFFGIIQYNALYRQLGWEGSLEHNLEVWSAWIDSGPALLLTLLAAGGLLFVYFRSDWDAQRKAEYYLCAWLSITLAAYISTAFPTFERYYVFTVPFLSVLAVAGVYAAGSRLYRADRPWQPIVPLALLLAFGLAKSLYRERDDMVWTDLEQTAKKVSEVTSPRQTLYADEAIYFLTRHEPPSGMEMDDSHKFDFPPPMLAFLHVIPRAELERRVKAGAFSTLETCEGEDDAQEHGYAKLFAKNATAGACLVFWDKK
jgi:hypothetical protein